MIMRKLNVFIATVCLFIVFIKINAQSEINFQKIDSFLIKLSNYNKILGTAAIAKDGKVIYCKRFGNDVNNRLEKVEKKEMKYRIGSISKMYTAVMIFQLIDEKKISLNDKLSKFFPEIPNADDITIDYLLTHRSGLFSFTNDSNYLKWSVLKKSENEMLNLFKNEKPVFKPGEKSEYSNTNFSILGYIIEKLTGDSYENELEKRIINKIGLHNTYYGTKIRKEMNEAQSYDFNEGKWELSSETDMSVPGGAGALVSTPKDMIKFIDALFDGKLISRNALDSMITLKGKYGRGIFINNKVNDLSYGHSGAIDAFRSDLFIFPGLDYTMAITYNGINYPRQKISGTILKILKKEPVDLNAFNILSLPDSILYKYEGNYTSNDIPISIKIKKEVNLLTAQATNQNPVYLDAKSDTIFEGSLNGIVLEFIKNSDESINKMILKQGGKEFIFTK